MKKNIMFVCIALFLAMSLIVSCDNSNKTPSAEPTPVEKYTVTFDTDGGGQIESQIIEKGKTATKPADPQKEGFEFKQWQTENGEPFNFSTPIVSNITLKATYYTATTVNNINELGNALLSGNIEYIKLGGDIEIQEKQSIPNSKIIIDGNGKTITSSYNPTSDGDYALAITGSNVVLKNIIIKTGLNETQSNTTKGFLAMIGSINDEPVDNISLENVEIITNGYIGSINIYSANGVVLDNVKIDDSKKGLINLHSSEVTIKSVNLPSMDSNIKAWASIQINGHGGSPTHGKCKLIIEDSSTIDCINQECIYTLYNEYEYEFENYDAQSEHEIIIKDGTSFVITPYNIQSRKHAGWIRYKRSLTTLAYDFSKKTDVIEFDHGTNSVSYVDNHAQMDTLGAYAYYPFVPTVNDSVELTYNIVIKKPEENTKGYIDFNNNYVTSLHTIQGYIELIADSNNVTAKDSSNGSEGQHSAEDVTFDYNANSEVALTITAKFKYNKTENEYSVDVSATDGSKTLKLGTRHATITTGDSVQSLFMCLSKATDTNGSYIKNLEFKVVENN